MKIIWYECINQFVLLTQPTLQPIVERKEKVPLAKPSNTWLNIWNYFYLKRVENYSKLLCIHWKTKTDCLENTVIEFQLFSFTSNSLCQHHEWFKFDSCLNVQPEKTINLISADKIAFVAFALWIYIGESINPLESLIFTQNWLKFSHLAHFYGAAKRLGFTFIWFRQSLQVICKSPIIAFFIKSHKYHMKLSFDWFLYVKYNHAVDCSLCLAEPTVRNYCSQRTS